MNNEIIHQIYDKFKNQSYEIFKIKDVKYPEMIDIKNALVYYIMYIWYKNNNNDYLIQTKKINYNMDLKNKNKLKLK